MGLNPAQALDYIFNTALVVYITVMITRQMLPTLKQRSRLHKHICNASLLNVIPANTAC